MSAQENRARCHRLLAPGVLFVLGLLLLSGCGSQSGRMPLEQLDPAKIPADERQKGQPEELVAVLAPRPRSDNEQRRGTKVTALAFHPTGRWLVSVHAESGSGYACVWGFPKAQKVDEAMLPDGRFCRAAFTPDGKTLILVHTHTQLTYLADFKDGKLALRRPQWLPKEVLQGFGFIRSVDFATDGRTMATSGDGKTVRWWDVSGESFTLKAAFDIPTGASAVAFAPGGQTLAVACGDKGVRLLDLTADPPREKAKLAHEAIIQSMAFAPDGKTLASGCIDKTLWLWNVAGEEAQVRAKLTGHAANVNAVCFAPGGSLLASGDQDSQVIVWDNAGAKLREWQNCGDLPVFAPDGRHLAIAGPLNAVYLVRLPALGR